MHFTTYATRLLGAPSYVLFHDLNLGKDNRYGDRSRERTLDTKCLNLLDQLEKCLN